MILTEMGGEAFDSSPLFEITHRILSGYPHNVIDWSDHIEGGSSEYSRTHIDFLLSTLFKCIILGRLNLCVLDRMPPKLRGDKY